jgi:hypothetical protein
MKKREANIEVDRVPMSAKRERYLLKLIRHLSKLESYAFRPRHGRFDFYGYLEEILKVNWKWRDKEVRRTRRAQLGTLSQPVIKPRRRRGTLHYLVLATSQQKPVVKNRWIQALRFADQHRDDVERDGLESFLQKHGGISGCARKAVRNKRATKNKSAVKAQGDPDETW